MKAGRNKYMEHLWQIFFDPMMAENFTKTEKEIFHMRYVEGKTLEETGKKFGVSRERIRQKQEKIILKFKEQPEFFRKQGEDRYRFHIAEREIPIPQMAAPKKELYTPIEILAFSPRTLNALINGGVGSVEQLLNKTEGELSNFRGFGAKAIDEVKSRLSERGMSLKSDGSTERQHFLDEFMFFTETLEMLIDRGLLTITDITALSPQELSAKIGHLNAEYVQKRIFEFGKWHLRNPNPTPREDMKFPIPTSEGFDFQSTQS
jgi:hypothetical protein